MTTSTLHALEWSEALNLSAKSHCDDIGSAGLKGHFGTDQSSPFDRILKFGKPGWWRGENLVFSDEKITMEGVDVDALAQEIVFKMFIDEGIAGRPNRSRMLNPEFKLVGIHSCYHGKDKANSMTVIDLTSSMKENEFTQQGIMKAQEENARAQSSAPATSTPVDTPLIIAERCSKLPSSVVSRDTCGYFDLINEIRKNPSSFIPTLEKRSKEIKAAVTLEISRVPSGLDDTEKTPDNWLQTERAMQVLRRTQPVAELEWNDALFLSAENHCNAVEKSNQQPVIFVEMFDAD